MNALQTSSQCSPGIQERFDRLDAILATETVVVNGPGSTLSSENFHGAWPEMDRYWDRIGIVVTDDFSNER
jgi:hypothetical protein